MIQNYTKPPLYIEEVTILCKIEALNRDLEFD